MTTYTPPVPDMMFVLRHVVGLDRLPQAKDLDDPTVEAILGEAGKLAAGVLAPLNQTGDREGPKLVNGAVTTPRGFKEAYAAYVAGGWNGVPFNPAFGGQGLPWALTFAVHEMWQSSNLSFSLCPLLNQAAIEALDCHGADEQKKTYLAKLISGEWTGTMNLTEPQAGTDLSALTTKAEKQADGTYLLKGQKIFITFGEHDMAPNIIHTVLARVPGAPEGIKGISLFIVPKFIPDAAGNPGTRNDVKCVSLEHKLGIHASPTCVMQYGEESGAIGYLMGRENEGLKYMFTMMNNARLCVGLQGVALAERAFQKAFEYARDRVQGFRLGEKNGPRVAIIEHEDVRRMLLSMKAQVEAGRMLAYEAALAMDMARGNVAGAQERVDLLTPVVKAWCTDMAVEVASTGIQVHGGMGFIEETGAAQFYRDARILPIYEGANGIHGIDLTTRKIILNKGVAARELFAEFDKTLTELSTHPEFADMHKELSTALSSLRHATEWVLKTGPADPHAVAAVNTPYLKAFGTVTGGAMMARAALAAKKLETSGMDPKFCAAKRLTAQFYMDHVLPQHAGHLQTVLRGSKSVTDFKPGMF